jgi:hypothetical protein
LRGEIGIIDGYNMLGAAPVPLLIIRIPAGVIILLHAILTSGLVAMAKDWFAHDTTLVILISGGIHFVRSAPVIFSR